MPVEIKKWRYYKLLESYNLHMMPRSVGFPLQRYIDDYNEYWNFFNEARGVSTCFTSSNSYPKIQRFGNSIKPISISVNTIFSDFDDAKKPENPLRDAKRLAEFQHKEGLRFLTAYSGSKGFANYQILKPTKFKFIQREDSGRYLKYLVEGIHIFFKNGFRNRPRYNSKKVRKWKLPTMDKQVMKDPKRLCRLMYSPHCSQSGYLNGRYCYPLHYDQIMKWDIKDVILHSTNPEFIIPDTTQEGKSLSLTDLIEHFDIDFTEIYSEIDFADINNDDAGDIPEEDTKVLLLMLESTKPCITNALKKEPDHFMRFCFAVWMKRIGKNVSEVTKHYSNVADHYKYVDRSNTDRRDYQIEGIFSNRYNSEPTCGKLIRDGYCLGEVCPKFHKEYQGYENHELHRK
jgi:hypothetical protein